ncbi:hypothetical protein S40293_04952, partial [Stachybotrys chartarum IBT 40293]
HGRPTTGSIHHRLVVHEELTAANCPHRPGHTMDADSENRGHRTRLTCAPCHRRKIKCDKNIPCDTCIRRGIAGSCRREDGPAAGGTPPTPARQPSEQHGSSAPVHLQALMERISHIEARLHQRDRTIVEQSSASSTPAPPGAQSTTSASRRPSTVVVDEDEPAPTGFGADDLDAATVLEFLAWGRKKDSDFVNAPEHDSGPRQPLPAQHSVVNPLAENLRLNQLDILEVLLPNKAHVFQLVEFHNSTLLWYHGSYSSKIFSDDLNIFFNEYGGSVRHEQLNMQWLALLFSVLTGSMTCASPPVCSSWGFSSTEQPTLSARWYDATVTCLNLAGYMEVHTVYSVQAIATLTIAAHILGNSNTQSVLLASAGRIAQSLGLHRLESDSTSPVDQLRKIEAGKRLFIQLCTQDWFSIPFSETYALSPRFISGQIRPLNCNDDDMALHPETVPTQASYCNYRFDIAALMPQLLDAMASCNTTFTRYEQVLKYDDSMRKLATASMPTFLSSNAPVAAEWPAYVRWGRRSLTICASHKIIMIHRKFVGLSFTNSAFTFTRRTCLAAAKTILREAFVAVDDSGPILWIEQAFSVAAGIILSLDMLHRAPGDKEYGEHKKLVADTIVYLKRFEHNKIATRGVHLLSFLLQRLDKSGSTESGKRPRTAADETHESPSRKRQRAFNMQSVIRDASQNLGVTSPATTLTTTPTPSVDAANSNWQDLIDLLPDQIGFDSQYLFDTFFPDQM